MTKCVLAFLLLPLGLFAQASNPSVFIFGTPPGGVGGACTTGTSFGYLTATGQVVSCVGSVWTAAGTGGGGGLTIGTTTISGGGTNALLYGDGAVLKNATFLTVDPTNSQLLGAVGTSTHPIYSYQGFPAEGFYRDTGAGGSTILMVSGAYKVSAWNFNFGTVLAADSQFAWTSTSGNPIGTPDTSIGRVSAGVVKISKLAGGPANGFLNLAGATFLDPTTTTGATRVLVSLGAADSVTTATLTNAGTTKSGGYQSSDGTAGVTQTCTILSITSFVVKNGLIVSCS